MEMKISRTVQKRRKLNIWGQSEGENEVKYFLAPS